MGRLAQRDVDHLLGPTNRFLRSFGQPPGQPVHFVVQVVGVARLFEFPIQGSNQLRLAADRIAELLDSLTMDATIDAFTYAHVWRLDCLGQSPDVALVGTKMRSGEKAPVHRIIVKGGVAE